MNEQIVSQRSMVRVFASLVKRRTKWWFAAAKRAVRCVFKMLCVLTCVLVISVIVLDPNAIQRHISIERIRDSGGRVSLVPRPAWLYSNISYGWLNRNLPGFLGQAMSVEFGGIPKIPTEALEATVRLGKLGLLSLCDVGLRDSDIELLPQMVEICQLYIFDNPVSDQSIAQLASISGLEVLDIRNTNITERGYHELKTRMPKCVVIWK